MMKHIYVIGRRARDELKNVESGKYRGEKLGLHFDLSVDPIIQSDDPTATFNSWQLVSVLEKIDNMELFSIKQSEGYYREGSFFRITNALAKCHTLKHVEWSFCWASNTELALFGGALEKLPSLESVSIVCSPAIMMPWGEPISAERIIRNPSQGIATAIFGGHNNNNNNNKNKNNNHNSIKKIHVTDIYGLSEEGDDEQQLQLEEFFRSCGKPTLQLEQFEFQTDIHPKLAHIECGLRTHNTNRAVKYLLCGSTMFKSSSYFTSLVTLKLRLHRSVDWIVFPKNLSENNSIKHLTLYREETNNAAFVELLETFHSILQEHNRTLEELSFPHQNCYLNTTTEEVSNHHELVLDAGWESKEYLSLLDRIRFWLDLNKEVRLENLIKVWDDDTMTYLLWLSKVSTKDVPFIYYYLHWNATYIFGGSPRCTTTSTSTSTSTTLRGINTAADALAQSLTSFAAAMEKDPAAVDLLPTNKRANMKAACILVADAMMMMMPNKRQRKSDNNNNQQQQIRRFKAAAARR